MNPAEEKTFTPGTADHLVMVDLPDLGIYDFEVEVSVEWNRHGMWGVTYIRIPDAQAGSTWSKHGAPGMLSSWHRVESLKRIELGSMTARLGTLHTLFLLRLAHAAEASVSDTVLDEMEACNE